MRQQNTLRGKKTKAGPLDVELGRRLRFARTLKGLSQTEVANNVGVTFQQIQKYERGTNRLAASRLPNLCSLYGKSYNFFLDGLGGDASNSAVAVKQEQGDVSAEDAFGFIQKYTKLIKIYDKFPDEDSKEFALQSLETMQRVLNRAEQKKAL